MKTDKMKGLFILLVAILNTLHKVLGESPCPNVFDYEDLQTNEDRWYGVIYLTTKSSLVGVRLDIRFDRPVILMVSWMGEVTSKNSKKFTILSLNEKLLPGPPLLSRFMVKFDRRHGIPELTTIRLNGQKICPPDPDFPIEPVTQNEGPIIDRPTKVTGNNYGSGLGSGGTHSSSSNTYTNSGSSFSNSGGSFGNSGSSTYNTGSNSYTNSNGNYNDKTSTTNRYSGGNSYTTNRSPGGNSYTTKATTTTERYSSGGSNSRPSYNQGSSQTSKPPTRVTTTTERTYSGSSSNNRPATHTSSKEDTVQMSYGGSSSSSSNKKPSATTSGHKPTQTSSQHSGEVYSGTGHKPTHTSTHSGESTSGTSNKKTQTSSSSTHTILHNVNSGTSGNKQTKPSSWETNTQSNVKRTTADSSSLNTNRKPDNSWESNTKLTQTSTSQVSKPQTTNQRPFVEQETGYSTECGLVDDQVANYLQSAPVPLITNGRQTTQGQWPWHIALYRTTGPESNYICGGTLITSNVVLTAAHCVFNKYDGRPVDTSNLVIYLGKYHLNQYSDDSGVQLKQVREMRVHPDYSSVSYAADIAILILTSPTEYTTFVRPCCLWRSSIQSVVGKTGTVVGWGFDENKQVSQELKMAEMPVVSQEICIESYRDFFERYASNRTYCAGSRTGVSACNGDSGGGMVFSLGSRWHLRGIVSIAVPKDNKICDPNHFIIFTDVAKYITWINENI